MGKAKAELHIDRVTRSSAGKDKNATGMRSPARNVHGDMFSEDLILQTPAATKQGRCLKSRDPIELKTKGTTRVMWSQR